VEKLEEKLDGLVTLLKSTHASAASDASSVPGILGTSSSFATPITYPNPALQSYQTDNSGQAWVHSGQGNVRPPPLSNVAKVPDQRPITPNMTPIDFNSPHPTTLEIPEFTSGEANGLLIRFREEMASFLPFLVIPPSLSAEDLNRERPFLLKAIFALASRVPSQRLALGKWLVTQLSNRMAVNGERNLDLLLGVLAYTGWFVTHKHFPRETLAVYAVPEHLLMKFSYSRCFYNCYNIPQLTLLVSLGTALIFDLGLNRPPPSNPSGKSVFDVAIRDTKFRPITVKSSRTLEERRTFLGMFYIISAFVINLFI
jgi:hypothetical protein